MSCIFLFFLYLFNIVYSMEGNENEYSFPIEFLDMPFLEKLYSKRPGLGLFLDETDGFARAKKNKNNEITFLIPKEEEMTCNFIPLKELINPENKMNALDLKILIKIAKKLKNSYVSKEDNGIFSLPYKSKREEEISNDIKYKLNEILAQIMYLSSIKNIENKIYINFKQRIIITNNKKLYLRDEIWTKMDRYQEPELVFRPQFYIDNQNQEGYIYIDMSSYYKPRAICEIIEKLMNALLLDIRRKEIKFKFIDIALENNEHHRIKTIIKWAENNKLGICYIELSYIRIFLYDEVNKE